MKKIEIFTGNRAEFGILNPLIRKLSEIYRIDLFVSGAHLLGKWNTLDEIKENFSNINNIKIIKLDIKNVNTDNYALYFSEIGTKYSYYKNENKKNVLFCLFLGDRIETFAYAASAFYFENILIHIAGGDIANVPTFDASVKHSITKLSHIHLVTNSQSFNVVKQLGEEEWRINNVGMPSLDNYDRQNFISKEELVEKYKLSSDNLIIITYHPEHYSIKESLNNFKKIINAISYCKYQVIITYPNNDLGYKLLINEIGNIKNKFQHIKIIKNLGTVNYLSLLEKFNVIMIGNSSGILTESSFFNTPGLIVGKRQTDRLRGKNVTEFINFTDTDISNYINYTFNNYEKLIESYKETQHIYGNGNSIKKITDFILNILKNKSRADILSKKFIKYNNNDN